MDAIEQSFLYGAVYYAVHGGSNFWVCGWNPKVWPFKWKLLSSTFVDMKLFSYQKRYWVCIVNYWLWASSF